MGLVQQPQFGSTCDHRREGYAPALPRGQRSDRDAVQSRGDTQSVQGRESVVDGRTCGTRPEVQVLDDGQVLVEERLVAEQADTPADLGPVTSQVVTENGRRTGGDGDQPGTQAQQRRLPGAVVAGEQDHLSPAHVQVHTGQCGEPADECDGCTKFDDVLQDGRLPGWWDLTGPNYPSPPPTGQDGHGILRTPDTLSDGSDRRRVVHRVIRIDLGAIGDGMLESGPVRRYGIAVVGRILNGVGKALIIGGLLVLGFVAFQLWGTGFETSQKQDDLRVALAADLGRTNVKSLSNRDLVKAAEDVDPVTAPPMPPPPEGEPVGVIKIPRIGVDWLMVEGVSRADLKKGPGHYPTTPLPGHAGNVGIAGHRTTYGAPFNRIDELIPGDEIIVATVQGTFTYEVIASPEDPEQAWYAVLPSQVEVLEDKGDDRITLTACHPKRSARERIIINAVLKSPTARAEPVSMETPAEPAETEPAETEEQATVSEQFDEGLSGDPSALPMAIGLGILGLAIAGAAMYLRKLTKPWIVWLCATPLILATIWFGYMYLDRYLPPL